MNYPKKAAYSLAQKMKQFRAKSEMIILSEVNPTANLDMKEVVRQMDWAKFDDVIEYLEFTYIQHKKTKVNS